MWKAPPISLRFCPASAGWFQERKLQLRLPPIIEGSIAATGSARNAVAHITSLITTREHLHLIGLSGFAALEYSMTEEATVNGVIDHLVELHEMTRKAIVAFQTVANVSAETAGNA